MSFRSHLQIAEVSESKSSKKDKNVLKLAILILLHTWKSLKTSSRQVFLLTIRTATYQASVG